METTYIAPDTKRVLVEYNQGGSATTTVGELRKLFSSYGKKWQTSFFNSLTTQLEASSPLAKYFILLD